MQYTQKQKVTHTKGHAHKKPRTQKTTHTKGHTHNYTHTSTRDDTDRSCHDRERGLSHSAHS